MLTEDAVKHFGSVAALADALEISVQAIYKWGLQVPKGRAFELESKTGGVLKAAADDEPGPASGEARCATSP